MEAKRSLVRKIRKVNSILPNVLVLKSKTNSKYLRYVNDEDAKNNKGLLAFTGEDAKSPDAKFHLEAATGDGNDGCVHIRSVYNNKYWSRLDENSSWIVANAKEPVEDRNLPSCTLFEPELVKNIDNDNVEARLLHVQLGAYAMLFSEEPDYDACVKAKSTTADPTSADVFTVTNWESFMILARYVALKSGSNGKYLQLNPKFKAVTQFTCDDIGDETVALEIIPENVDGTVVLIKSRSTGNFFAVVDPSGGWVDVVPKNSDFDPNIFLFSPVKVNSSTIALRSLRNNKFCKLDTGTYQRGGVECTNIFLATSTNMTKETFLLVEEPVLARTVSVVFRFDHARIYDVAPLTVVSQTATNKTDHDVTVTINFSHKFSTTTTWDNSISIKAGVETTFETGIPFIAKGELKISLEASYTHNWGGAVTTEDTVDYQVQVQVPKSKKVEASLLARQGTCDVPFSYIQTDTYADGSKVSSDFYDGVYTGVGYFDFNSVTEPLDA